MVVTPPLEITPGTWAKNTLPFHCLFSCVLSPFCDCGKHLVNRPAASLHVAFGSYSCISLRAASCHVTLQYDGEHSSVTSTHGRALSMGKSGVPGIQWIGVCCMALLAQEKSYRAEGRQPKIKKKAEIYIYFLKEAVCSYLWRFSCFVCRMSKISLLKKLRKGPRGFIFRSNVAYIALGKNVFILVHLCLEVKSILRGLV